MVANLFSIFKKDTSLKETLKKENLKKQDLITKERGVFENIDIKIFKALQNTKYSISKLWKKDENNYSKLQESIEESLINFDFGTFFSAELAERIVDKIKFSRSSSIDEIKKNIADVLMEFYGGEKTSLNLQTGSSNIWLILGANGGGKTTSIAKLAFKYKNEGKKVLLVAGDTFRAGAAQQLKIWADKLGVDIVLPEKDKQDPASLVYKALQGSLQPPSDSDNQVENSPVKQDCKYDLILCDTSGRQHNNVNLMQEIKKINSIIQKVNPDAPHESFLTIDSTQGNTGFLQAKQFLEVADVTGLIMTKLDNAKRGGAIFGIKHKYGIPTKFIGTGETLEDLYVFEIESIVKKIVDTYN